MPNCSVLFCSVLHKLKKELSSLKAESLNPAAVRARQAATNGTTASLLVDNDAIDMIGDGRRAGGWSGATSTSRFVEPLVLS